MTTTMMIEMIAALVSRVLPHLVVDGADIGFSGREQFYLFLFIACDGPIAWCGRHGTPALFWLRLNLSFFVFCCLWWNFGMQKDRLLTTARATCHGSFSSVVADTVANVCVTRGILFHCAICIVIHLLSASLCFMLIVDWQRDPVALNVPTPQNQ